MSGLYYSPEVAGLKVFGEISWSDEPYQFNLTAIWRRDSDGMFFYADDQGCSCPSPFEDFRTVGDLTPVTSLTAFQAEMLANLKDPDTGLAVVSLIDRMREAGAR